MQWKEARKANPPIILVGSSRARRKGRPYISWERPCEIWPRSIYDGHVHVIKVQAQAIAAPSAGYSTDRVRRTTRLRARARVCMSVPAWVWVRAELTFPGHFRAVPEEKIRKLLCISRRSAHAQVWTASVRERERLFSPPCDYRPYRRRLLQTPQHLKVNPSQTICTMQRATFSTFANLCFDAHTGTRVKLTLQQRIEGKLLDKRKSADHKAIHAVQIWDCI